MDDLPQFRELLQQVRNGDAGAAYALVKHFEPAIRRVVRLRLANLPLQSIVESMDICQSVMASFFVRMNLGQYDFQEPTQLVALLATMARSKLAAQARFNQAQRRDRRRHELSSRVLDNVSADNPTPSRELDARELLKQVYQRLTDDQRTVASLRAEGRPWEEIAIRMRQLDPRGGHTAEALRKQLARAVDRITNELQLELYFE